MNDPRDRSDEAPSDQDEIDEPYVVVATSRDIPPAHLTAGFLADRGLDARVTDEYTVGADWLMSIAIGGVGVEVPASQVEQARQFLAEADPVTEIPADDLPAELRTDDTSAEEDEAYYSAHRQSNRLRGVLAVVFMAPIMLPAIAGEFIWRRLKGATSKPSDGEVA